MLTIEAAYFFCLSPEQFVKKSIGNPQGTMAQSGSATDLYVSPSTGLVHQLRQNPYVLGLASVRAQCVATGILLTPS